ncbi:MAG: ribosomal protein S18-alanine N-acetyltransferase [Gammaproteobacteria bacterium]|nr:ribosomal protein S18-alanine N-acetyltransferase [Gammaproteobacteria bacterium]MBT3869027.1 ribosomal protein S18-alanine N-acetyltransferase [Gammaproteobacteria bacterium]MBT4379513.1 ribosomal protein S18-alanine N-acetyltransferase [Gammaproteobacteria bacterium]MBT5443823.1 ribosomal protein S18-alanine N-acetyltransferase [Gammaproteobacteria bacterium]MBT6569862.1 ribosomal protein S18-alanine N-acetyltransferase [Gammaproteobacteria bacterium]
MQLTDLPDVLRNERRGYTHPWTEGIFRDCLRNGQECWLLMCSDQNVGHGILSVAAGESHLLNVCVHPDFQGHGFGRILVEHLLERARTGEASTIFLEVRPSNVAACELYDKLGFNEVGIRENYYPSNVGREDALVLAKELF